jgi:YggT family protein
MDFILFFLVNLIRIVKYAILVRILMSWVGGTKGRIGQIIYEITEPILKIFRNLLPKMGMIDLSPLIAFFVLDFAQIGIVSLFASL